MSRFSRWMQSRSLPGLTPGPYDITIRKDLRVPMDDGVELLADLITPVGEDRTGLPTIVIRGPYGRRGGVAKQARALAREGFPVLFQSCRGTWGSGGVFTPQVDEARDGAATHRWVRGQQWFTGTLATFGPSYMGYTQWAAAAGPDALCLQVTMPDFGAVTWDNGAFALRNALGWTQMMDRMIRRDFVRLFLGMLRPDKSLRRGFGTLPLSAGDSAATGRPVHWYQDWVGHESLADEYWTQQSHTASVPAVTAPVYMITGWYDIFLPWQIRTYTQLAEAGRPPRLTIGPWGHSDPALDATAVAEAGAFLKGEAPEFPVRAFRTGADRWHDLPSWPPPGVTGQSWYLHADGRLRTGLPDGGTTSYVYDPADPTPASGGPSLLPKQGPVDDSGHESRPDVVVFRGDVLAEPVTLAGTPVARVRFRSSRPSADVFVRITDVHPDGRAMSVCDAIRRVDRAETEQELEIELWPVFHRFAAGHRISVQVSSGAHPRYARNPGSGEPAATAVELHRADQEIFHDPVRPSHLVLPVWIS
ncbi:MAG TPA: CocE/NonD family hydrolase [Actinoplanes sp.]|nr:CocE/NonD family hydrolase [Actinoplanes sp.]